MLDIEKTFFTDPEFATFCVAEVADASTCRTDPHSSILSFFYQISATRDANNETVST